MEECHYMIYNELVKQFFTDLRSAITYNTTISSAYDSLFDYDKEILQTYKLFSSSYAQINPKKAKYYFRFKLTRY